MFWRSMLPMAIAWASIAPALAQTYPERAIKIIVPQPPGGGFDTVARVLADRLSPRLGQPLLVENRRRRPPMATHLSPAETEALIRRDVERWTTLIRAAGISGSQ